MAFEYGALQPLGRADLSHRRPTNLKKFYYGVCYYPEHWTAEEREADPERMAKAGMNVVRMAEFAWDRMEPREGAYDFSFFDEQIQRLAAQGISTILCTPTAAPPRWLTKRFPQTLRVNHGGQAMQHGSRQQCCHSSDTFRAYSRRITAAMAEHFKDNPHVVGWQTDNEFLCHFSQCYCPSCEEAFPDYLRWRYGNDIGRLNADWGTAFWAQTYDDFSDIPLPHETMPAYENPSHRLAYKLYLADAVARFQHEQVELLRAANPGWLVTHNGVFGNMDGRGDYVRDLDFIGYDTYPFFCYDHAHRPASHAAGLDRMRGFSGNFIVPEHQSGPGGQRPYFHDTPEPGEMRRLTYASIARGADSLLYFRWRTCRFGAEEYWCGILDHDNITRRRYEEAAQTGFELKRIGAELLGTSVRTEVALAGCDLAVDEAHQSYTLGLPDHNNITWELHGALYAQGYATGFVHPSDDLSGLKLYVIPHWAYFDEAWVANLEKFVQGGGVLVFGARTATRDTRNQVVAQTIPGCLRGLCGVTVEECGHLNRPEEREYRLALEGGADVLAKDWYELVQPLEGTEVVASWTTRHVTGGAAITRRKHGKGQVWYVGTYLTDGVKELLLPRLCVEAGLGAVHPCWQPGLEIVLRENKQKELWFLLNQSGVPMRVENPPQGEELITQQQTGAVLELAAHEVAVVRSVKR